MLFTMKHELSARPTSHYHQLQTCGPPCLCDGAFVLFEGSRALLSSQIALCVEENVVLLSLPGAFKDSCISRYHLDEQKLWRVQVGIATMLCTAYSYAPIAVIPERLVTPSASRVMFPWSYTAAEGQNSGWCLVSMIGWLFLVDRISSDLVAAYDATVKLP